MATAKSEGKVALACCHHPSGQGAFRERKPDMTGSRAGRLTTIGFVFSASHFDVPVM
jgi:hypothetical protein